MMTDPYPDLLFPTCAECAGIGITAIPPFLWDMEDDCGPEVMKAIVLAYGGREVIIGPVKIAAEDQDLITQGKAWIFAKRGHGSFRIPKGPGTRSYRAAWAIYHQLKAGRTLDDAARCAGVDLRTVKIARDDFADDQYGAFGKMFSEMGLAAKKHPDELVFELLKNGFSETCYDGPNFFDTDHPYQPDLNGDVISVSNMQRASRGFSWPDRAR